jgi:hypothetical protein
MKTKKNENKQKCMPVGAHFKGKHRTVCNGNMFFNLDDDKKK